MKSIREGFGLRSRFRWALPDGDGPQGAHDEGLSDAARQPLEGGAQRGLGDLAESSSEKRRSGDDAPGEAKEQGPDNNQ